MKEDGWGLFLVLVKLNSILSATDGNSVCVMRWHSSPKYKSQLFTKHPRTIDSRK